MWSLIVVASLLLIFSITANWVQRAVLDTDELVNTSDEILKDKDVQEELSFFLVDQLYANVDVQGEIEEKLPDNVQGAVCSRRGGNEAARSQRFGESAGLASCPGPRRNRHPRVARAVR